MEESTFRVLDSLSRNLGKTPSIQELTHEIGRQHKRAYYANVYKKVRALEAEGLLRVSAEGGSAHISLDFERYAVIDRLAEMEIHRKRALTTKRRTESALDSLDEGLSTLSASAGAVEPIKNLKLNRYELIVLTTESWSEVDHVLDETRRRHNLRIDFLPVTTPGILERLTRSGHDSIKKMLYDCTWILLPQVFWAAIARGSRAGLRLEIEPPSRPTRGDLLFNLEQFGYPLLGGQGEGAAWSLEDIVVEALADKDTRTRLGAAVVLAKNEADPYVLAFLALKTGNAGRLLGMLEAMTEVLELSAGHASVVDILQVAGVEGEAVDGAMIENTLRAYNVS